MSDAPSSSLLARLEGLLGPRGFSREAADLEPWLTDWRGRYRGTAAALLSPASTAEVQAIVSLCAAERVALVPQGGNTSMVGGATPSVNGTSLIVSLRRMDAIRTLSPDDNIVVAEAGVILSALHDAAIAAGRRFPLSLAAKGSATIGGLVATNAGGTQVLRFGAMRALVVGLEAVLPDGSLFDGLSALRKDNRGYDLTQLLVGAEGTLGIVTAASLRLVAATGTSAVAWVGLDTPACALRLLRRLEALTGDAVESFELVPANALDLVLQMIPGTRAPLTAPQRWNVLVEAVAPPAAALEAGAQLAAALETCFDEGLLADATVAATEAQAAQLWRLREAISEAERHRGSSAKHDVSVPVSAMPAFIEAAADAVRGRFPGSRVIAFGHLGDGNVHFNVQPPEGAGDAWLESEGPVVSAFVHDLVTAAGGSISAEHGIGQMKREEYLRTGDPVRIAAQRAIKHALDPDGILNPGKLL